MKDMKEIALDTLGYLAEQSEKHGHSEVLAIGAVIVEGLNYITENYGHGAAEELLKVIGLTPEE